MTQARQQLAQLFEARGKYKRASHWLDGFLVILILANVVAIVLESVASLAIKYSLFFTYFELASVIIFAIEYLARLWSSVDLERFDANTQSHGKKRLHYFLSPLAIIDLIAILPSLLMLFMNIDLRFLRVLRLLRVFKLTRYSRAMQLLLASFQEEASSLLAAFFIIAVVLILASCGIYLLEHDVQPDKFGSIPEAMWWAIVTLATVGYGDVVPITPMGRFFGGVITLLSMGMVAIPTGLLASSFSDQLRQRRNQYSEYAYQCMEDGKISRAELKKLEELRIKLGLSKPESRLLLNKIRGEHPHHKFCSNCGHKIN